VRGRFSLPLRRDDEIYLSRTHPFVEGLANYVLTCALDDLKGGVAARCGVIRTSAVERRTTLLLVRYRFDVVTIRERLEQVLLAEDAGVIAFAGAPDNPTWLTTDLSAPLLSAIPHGNVAVDQATRFVNAVVAANETLTPRLEEEAVRRAEQLLVTHRRIRNEAGIRRVRYRVDAHQPPDVLGIYVLLPPVGAAIR
jgi:hypothetical protein